MDHIIDETPRDRAERTTQGAHDTGGHGTLEPERVTDRHDELADPQPCRVSQLRGGDRLRLGPQHREVGVGIVAHQLGAHTAPVAERDVDLRRIVDHVAVRENEPVGRKHESRAVTGNLSRRASPPLHPTPHFHTDDRRTNSLRRPRHRL